MEPILHVDDLKTSFATGSGTVQAVRGVSFTLNKGEALGIVGESGSGKSVTSMSILQLLGSNAKVVGGSIEFEGKNIVAMKKNELHALRGDRISMIFQDPMSSLNPLMRVGAQIAEMIMMHNPKMKGDEIDAEVLRLMSLVRIPEPEKRVRSFPHEFSGGMRQRVMIAMALACKPDILIADEPTTALDVTIQDQIIKLLRQLQQEFQMSIIFITHDLGVVAEICSRVLVMYGGLVMEEACIDDLFQAPSHPYTIGLLGSMPSIRQDKSQRLTPIPGSPPDMLRPPEGCPFAARCPWARNICDTQRPEYTLVSDTHRSMCWLLHPDAPRQDNPFKEGRP